MHEVHLSCNLQLCPAIVSCNRPATVPCFLHLQDLAELLCRIPGLSNLSLQELHELEDFDNLDVTSLWDALDAAVAAPGGFAGRLVGLSVSGCFWNTAELFGVLKQLTGLTQLRYLQRIPSLLRWVSSVETC